MKKMYLGAAALAAAVVAQPALASVHFSGGVSDVSARDTDPGLVIESYGLNSSFSFDLNVGDSATVDLFFVGTQEASVNGDDAATYPIDVTFDFLTPSGSGSVGGSTNGFVVSGDIWTYLLNPCGGLAGGCGQAVFTPTTFTFSNGSQLAVELSNVVFTTPGAKKVTGTFTMLTAVPEASTWAMMFVGFGAMGMAMRRRKVAVSFA